MSAAVRYLRPDPDCKETCLERLMACRAFVEEALGDYPGQFYSHFANHDWIAMAKSVSDAVYRYAETFSDNGEHLWDVCERYEAPLFERRGLAFSPPK